jgi:actin-like ATPase involved in cell morphogenesis
MSMFTAETLPPHYSVDGSSSVSRANGTVPMHRWDRILLCGPSYSASLDSNEPTAAAIAYGLNKKGGESQIIVYDLGGGTFDVSLLSIDDGVFEVLATAGDTHLGGEDFDNCIIDYLVKQYKKKTGTDVTSNLCAIGKLKCEVEKANCTLSSQQYTRIEIESFEDGNDFSETLTCAKFEELNMDLFRKTMKPVEQVLKDAKANKEDVDEVKTISHLSFSGRLTHGFRLSSLVVLPVFQKFSNF